MKKVIAMTATMGCLVLVGALSLGSGPAEVPGPGTKTALSNSEGVNTGGPSLPDATFEAELIAMAQVLGDPCEEIAALGLGGDPCEVVTALGLQGELECCSCEDEPQATSFGGGGGGLDRCEDPRGYARNCAKCCDGCCCAYDCCLEIADFDMCWGFVTGKWGPCRPACPNGEVCGSSSRP